MKEKEALESAISTQKDVQKKSVPEDAAGEGSTRTAEETESNASKEQIATIMNSLATLSAEKSRMEMSFQLDKKQLRQDLAEKDKRIREMEEKLKQNVNRNDLELEGLKSKLIVERHTREKETNDQLMMVKELQKLLSDERHLKEHLEMQLNDLKLKFSSMGTQNKQKDLQAEIEKLKHDLQEMEQSKQGPGSIAIEQLQEQNVFIQSLRAQHAAALKYEQGRTAKAEEEVRQLSLLHEESVSNLESRLAELSTTAGNYERLRQQDQEQILRLKEKLLDVTSSASPVATISSNSNENRSFEDVLEEFQQLKQVLQVENAKLKHPVDVSGILSLKNDHMNCLNEQKLLRTELSASTDQCRELAEEVSTQKQHIKNLQEKITVLNKNIEDQEMELKQAGDLHRSELKSERDKWRQVVSNMELELRAKTEEMENHLQKQRERSLNLLEEKDNEIKALKTSFDLFLPVESNSDNLPTSPTSSTGAPHTFLDGSAKGMANSNEQFHILHYVHELARKDVEVSSLRKAKHSAETAMRQAIKDKITSQQELHDQIAVLEEQVGR